MITYGEILAATGIRAAVVGAAAAAMLGLVTVPAQAAGATSCPSDGDLPGSARCSSLSNGVLSTYSTSTGNYVHVAYYRKSGGSLTAKLGHERSSVNNWWAYQNMSSVPFHYEQMKGLTASCSPMIGKLYTSAGATYSTPPVDPC
ncbi:MULTISPECIES: hypothetical protein [unclassified Streptomyces]|uniref:hypothetical protein n=1 Tax=Streptomyces sp. NPDC127129 TaxID=3345373 RepID=UPI00363D68D9